RHDLVAPGLERQRVVAVLVGRRLGRMAGVVGRSHGPDPRSWRTRRTHALDGTGRTSGDGPKDPGRARGPGRPAARDERPEEGRREGPAHVPGTCPTCRRFPVSRRTPKV